MDDTWLVLLVCALALILWEGEPDVVDAFQAWALGVPVSEVTE